MAVSFQPKKIFVAKDPIDFRKGLQSLARLVADRFDSLPTDQSLYVFTNHSKNKLKCLFYDGTAYWMFVRSLNSGHFDWNLGSDPLLCIREEQFNRLLDGLNIHSGKVFKTCYRKYV